MSVDAIRESSQRTSRPAAGQRRKGRPPQPRALSGTCLAFGARVRKHHHVTQPDRESTPVGAWLADLRRAWAVWRRTPVLPAVAITIAAIGFVPNLFAPTPRGCGASGHPACTSGSPAAYALFAFLSLPALLYGVGFYGAERWWYSQISAGLVPSSRMLWRISWSYFWRFVRLGLVALVLAVPIVPFLVVIRHSTTRTSIALGVWAFALDIAFTFVTPALAFSTDSAWSALRIGAGTLNRLWPRDWVYAVIPPMALTILTRFVPHAFGPRWATAAAGAGAQVLTVLFAGATTMLYVREIDPEAPERLRYGPPSKRSQPNHALEKWRADEPA